MVDAITQDERRWRAESDARTLAEANVIKTDKSRLEAATTAAQRMAEQTREEAAAMSKVARQKSRQTSEKSPSRVRKQSGTNSGLKQNQFNVFKKI